MALRALPERLTLSSSLWVALGPHPCGGSHPPPGLERSFTKPLPCARPVPGLGDSCTQSPGHWPSGADAPAETDTAWMRTCTRGKSAAAPRPALLHSWAGTARADPRTDIRHPNLRVQWKDLSVVSKPQAHQESLSQALSRGEGQWDRGVGPQRDSKQVRASCPVVSPVVMVFVLQNSLVFRTHALKHLGTKGEGLEQTKDSGRLVYVGGRRRTRTAASGGTIS